MVVLFNHEADAHEAARGLMRSILGQGEAGGGADPVACDWNGDYLDAANGLLLGVKVDGAALNTHYGTSPERLHVGANGTASSSSMTLSRDGNAIQLARLGENLKAVATRIAGRLPRHHSERKRSFRPVRGPSGHGAYACHSSGGRRRVRPVLPAVDGRASAGSMDDPG